MWFHLKAPAYDPEKDVSTELNVTIVTHYCWTTGKSVLIIKYRPYGVEVVCDEMKRQVKESLSIRPTSLLSDDPFALHLIHLFLYVQFWWNALRGPRSYVGHQVSSPCRSLKRIFTIRQGSYCAYTIVRNKCGAVAHVYQSFRHVQSGPRPLCRHDVLPHSRARSILGRVYESARPLIAPAVQEGIG